MPTLNDLTYGRSNPGRQKVLNEYQRWINAYKRYIDGDQYNKVVSAIRNGWSGTDANTFLLQLERITVELKKRTSMYIYRMDNALKYDSYRFSDLQDKNRMSIESIKTKF